MIPRRPAPAGSLAGAGDIGVALDTASNLLQSDRVAMPLFAEFAAVTVAEIALTYMREQVISCAPDRRTSARPSGTRRHPRGLCGTPGLKHPAGRRGRLSTQDPFNIKYPV